LKTNIGDLKWHMSDGKEMSEEDDEDKAVAKHSAANDTHTIPRLNSQGP